MAKREVWICNNSNIKYQKVKSAFLEAMHQQTKDPKINYYDFLLVAKKLSFRFEESSHLMALKNYFAKNKNSVIIKKMADLLCISQESIHANEEKIIVKFTVPDTQFAPIKEETHEDEQADNSDPQLSHDMFEKIGNDFSQDQQSDISEKMAIILSIKVDEMQKKIKALTGDRETTNLIEEARNMSSLTYDDFKILVLNMLVEVRENVKMSQDDIKTIFFVLDSNKKGTLSFEDIQQLGNIQATTGKLKEFYKSRINKDMVKNTLFKLGKVKNNSIQIYQVKNASLLEFQNIERSIVQEREHKAVIRTKQARIPHFGPLKGAALANRQRQTLPAHISSISKGNEEIRVERERIQKILRMSKEQKRKDKKGDTVASKLRSLFIHKVILPRQKMLQEEKQRYLRHKGVDSDLFVRANK